MAFNKSRFLKYLSNFLNVRMIGQKTLPVFPGKFARIARIKAGGQESGQG